MQKLIMPKERKFGWKLKPTSSVHWGQTVNKSGQICVVLEHSLLRGVTSEMIAWWFNNFANLSVTLEDIKGYEGVKVPAYLLWHPSDHIAVQMSGKLGVNNTAVAGGKIHIKEAMQYNKYGFKYPVNNKLKIFYCENDGWGMGREIPLLGKLVFLRICYTDVYENGKLIGVHYHYEVVAGTSKRNFLAKAINNKIVGGLTPDFWKAWITHNTIEVGVFENFLPVLYSQRNDLENLHYSKSMNPITEDIASNDQNGFDFDLLNKRLEGYKNSENAFDYQNGIERSNKILG
ncbi:hypothetical protein [Vibrio coralliirubri]|uniref:hypothetical protein n=1 Tax=Vibrio coralliirubri TaxID=1516159 RepID=UPI000EFBD9B2|nr:hypothetical protein [Vibrio coralliirubri]